jgi:predicted nucleic acid-binding protein
MNEPVFVDASAWIAITNRKDRNRREAVKIFRRLLGTRSALLT